MKTKNNIFVAVSLFFIAIGFALSLGSIASFIAMNIIAAKPLSPNDFVVWQRHFITPIMNYASIPGIVLFLCGNGLFLFQKTIRKTDVTLFLLSVIVFVNGMFFIVPTAHKANVFANNQIYLAQHWDTFLEQKTIEDSLGGANLLLLLSYLFVFIYLIIRDKLKI